MIDALDELGPSFSERGALFWGQLRLRLGFGVYGWAGTTGRPTSMVLILAIVLLVSGSIGFRGLATATAGQLAVGEQQFLQNG